MRAAACSRRCRLERLTGGSVRTLWTAGANRLTLRRLASALCRVLAGRALAGCPVALTLVVIELRLVSDLVAGPGVCKVRHDDGEMGLPLVCVLCMRWVRPATPEVEVVGQRN